MNNENKIVELLSEMVYKQDKMIDEIKAIQKEQQITNVSIKELRTSVMRLADEIMVFHDHEKRIGTLEKKILK